MGLKLKYNITQMIPNYGIGIYILPLLLLIGLAGIPSLVSAETRYVSDELTITLRRGEGTGFQVLRTLKSGTALNILQTNPNTGYSLVRTPAGTEGYVLTRFLMDQPSARNQLQSAQTRADQLETENKTLSEQITALTQEKGELEQARSNLDKSHSQLSSELSRVKSTSSRALEMEGENKELRSKVVKLERDNQALSQENETLKDRNARDWFMVGAGVAILSLLLGLLLSRFGGRRKTSWSSM